ncbi:MAG: FHA domain-containing protein, partial [Nannocystaceae bacterium]
MPSLRITVIDHQQGSRRQHRCSSSPLRIGRDPSNDLVLAEPFVARWQAVLRFDAEGLTICVLSGSNPLRRGGRPLATGSQIELGAREVLTLGTLELRLDHRPEEGAAVGPVRSGPPHPEEGAMITGPEPAASGPVAAVERAKAALERLRAEHLRVAAATRAWDEDCDRALAALERDVGDPSADAAAALLRRELAALGSLGRGPTPRDTPLT